MLANAAICAELSQPPISHPPLNNRLVSALGSARIIAVRSAVRQGGEATVRSCPRAHDARRSLLHFYLTLVIGPYLPFLPFVSVRSRSSDSLREAANSQHACVSAQFLDARHVSSLLHPLVLDCLAGTRTLRCPPSTLMQQTRRAFYLSNHVALQQRCACSRAAPGSWHADYLANTNVAR
jgi:hypothetical protein